MLKMHEVEYKDLYANQVPISVVIPLYNSAESLKRAVDSVLGCVALPREIILVDDASTDLTRAVALELADRYTGLITVGAHPDGNNHGAGASRNLGVKMCRNAYVAFLDADDMYLPNRFDGLVERFAEQKSVVAIHQFGLVSAADASDQDAGQVPSAALGLRVASGGPLIDSLVRGYAWQMNAITVRRSFFESTGGFCERLRIGEDLELWLRMAMVGEIIPSGDDSPVCVYFRHSKNRSRANQYEEMIPILRSALDWAKKQGVATQIRQQVLNTAIGWVHGVSTGLRARGDTARASALVRQFAGLFPSSLRSRLFVGEALRSIVG